MSSFIYHNVYLNDFESIAGPEEKKGNLTYQNTIDDYYYEEQGFEDAELKMQHTCLNNLIKRNKLNNKVNLLVGGDLINQITITSYNISNYNIPFLGVYNGCSTFNESIIILANFIESKAIKNGIAITSSHNLNAERQFRYPVEYGIPKKKYTTFTTTGAASALLSNKPSNIKIESSTIGKVIDYGIKDVSNMGAVMAPSAADTLINHLKEMNRDITYYDVIVTGDLGILGSELFRKILKEDHNLELSNYFDASSILYKEEQETFEGGSGPVVIPLVLFNYILKVKEYKKILLLATGSLHNPLMVNLKKSIPSITHAISIEVIK